MQDQNPQADQKSALRKEYQSRLNKVLDYIDKHLSEELTLEKLAAIANFSAYHFHRLFKSLIGENLFQFIQRLRLEKAADRLCQNKDIPITQIAYEYGYSDSASFAKAFGNYFGMSASEWRAGGHKNHSNIGKMNSKTGNDNDKNGKASQFNQYYFSNAFSNTFNNFIWRIEMTNESKLAANVEVKELSEETVAYIRHIGPYAGNEQLFGMLFGKLFQWAGARGLIRFPETKALTIYHDNPDITEEDKLRISVCITVPPDCKVDGEIGKMTIPGGKYAVAHFEISPNQYGEAWNMLYGGWLPESGYQPDDRPCFEMYLNDPKSHPEGKHIVDIYAPVKAL